MEKTEPKISSLLVLGGARSGKSRFAQASAEATQHSLFFIATATAGDAEMAERIARHQAARGARWTTLEEPLALADRLKSAAGPKRMIVVDCVSFWLANLMFAERDLDVAIDELAEAVATLAGPVIFVSNEVGSSVVPDHAMGRRFRDAQGWLNQALARQCDCVVLVTAGLPVLLKPAKPPEISF